MNLNFAFFRLPFFRSGFAILAITSIFLSTACTPAQETTVLNDISAVVSLGESLLSVVQSFGALNTPQEKADILTAEQYAQDESAAASSAITEFNSTDAWDVKVDKITALFTAVTPIPNLPTAKINAAVQLLTAAVKLLLAQLGSVAAPVSASAHFVSTTTLKTDVKDVNLFFSGFFPGTFHHKLKVIQKKADATVALAGRLKAATRLK